MRRISIQSIVIGIGIGMMLTSSLNLLYNNVFKSNIEDNTVTYALDIDDDEKKEDSEKYRSEDQIEEVDFYEIVIEKGMTTEEIAFYLVDKNVIQDASEFIEVASKLGMTSKLNYGSKEIPYESSLEEILIILSKPT